MPFKVDPELAKAMMAMTGGQPPPPPPAKGDYLARRNHIAALFGSIAPKRNAQLVECKDFSVTAGDGHEVPLRLFTNKETAGGPTAGILYIHGGGYIGGTLDLYEGIVAKYTENTGVPLLAVDYRLAPEAQYPLPVSDCHAGLLWLFEHAGTINVDPRRIAVMGDSAGGGLAAALTHLNLERRGPQIAKQLLIYPMLDDRNVERDAHLDMAVWTSEDNETGWDCLLGDRRGKEGLPPSAVPARVTDATGLPDAYIDTGELDIFRTEDLEYAAKLGKAGVSVEMHVYPGCPHGFDVMAPDIRVSRRAFEDRYHAIATIQRVPSTKL